MAYRSTGHRVAEAYSDRGVATCVILSLFRPGSTIAEPYGALSPPMSTAQSVPGIAPQGCSVAYASTAKCCRVEVLGPGSSVSSPGGLGSAESRVQGLESRSLVGRREGSAQRITGDRSQPVPGQYPGSPAITLASQSSPSRPSNHSHVPSITLTTQTSLSRHNPPSQG
eukprot:267846-Rhodomonas_salina.1